MTGSFEQKLRELIEPIVQSYGLQLWGLRYNNGHSHAHLQIFVDGENGVDAENCGDIANALSPVMDAADLIEPAYTLEVSSPGLDRFLFTLEQIERYVGEEIRVELRMPQLNRGSFTGKLVAVNGDVIALEMKDKSKKSKAKGKANAKSEGGKVNSKLNSVALQASSNELSSLNSSDEAASDSSVPQQAVNSAQQGEVVEIVYSNVKSARLIPDFAKLIQGADA